MKKTREHHISKTTNGNFTQFLLTGGFIDVLIRFWGHTEWIRSWNRFESIISSLCVCVCAEASFVELTDVKHSSLGDLTDTSAVSVTGQ